MKKLLDTILLISTKWEKFYKSPKLDLEYANISLDEEMKASIKSYVSQMISKMELNTTTNIQINKIIKRNKE